MVTIGWIITKVGINQPFKQFCWPERTTLTSLFNTQLTSLNFPLETECLYRAGSNTEVRVLECRRYVVLLSSLHTDDIVTGLQNISLSHLHSCSKSLTPKRTIMASNIIPFNDGLKSISIDDWLQHKGIVPAIHCDNGIGQAKSNNCRLKLFKVGLFLNIDM